MMNVLNVTGNLSPQRKECLCNNCMRARKLTALGFSPYAVREFLEKGEGLEVHNEETL